MPPLGMQGGLGGRRPPNTAVEDVFCHKYLLADFFENNYFLFCGLKTDLGRTWLVLGEIIFICLIRWPIF